MEYSVGDRVECIRGYQGGVFPGELGTVVSISISGLGVRWDDKLERRHTCGNRCERGHGWNVAFECVKPLAPDDLGELPVLDIREIL